MTENDREKIVAALLRYVEKCPEGVIPKTPMDWKKQMLKEVDSLASRFFAEWPLSKFNGDMQFSDSSRGEVLARLDDLRQAILGAGVRSCKEVPSADGKVIALKGKRRG